MTLHEVQGAAPGKFVRAIPVQRSPAKGNGYNNVSTPKAASSLPQAGISPDSIKQVRALAVQ